MVADSEKFSLHPIVWNAMRFDGVLIFKFFIYLCTEVLL